MDGEGSACPRCGHEHLARAKLIRKLLETYHLSVPERRQLVPPSIHFLEVLTVIRDVVEREGSFSSMGLTLAKLEGGTYRLHYLTYDPSLSDRVNDSLGPTIPATFDYASVESWVETFMQGKQDIDGIQVLGCPPAGWIKGPDI
jgi:hypothetical protein